MVGSKAMAQDKGEPKAPIQIGEMPTARLKVVDGQSRVIIDAYDTDGNFLSLALLLPKVSYDLVTDEGRQIAAKRLATIAVWLDTPAAFGPAIDADQTHRSKKVVETDGLGVYVRRSDISITERRYRQGGIPETESVWFPQDKKRKVEELTPKVLDYLPRPSEK